MLKKLENMMPIKWLQVVLVIGFVAEILGHFSEFRHLEEDSRLIHFQDLMSSAKRFYDPDTSSYSELLFDVARNQVIVGARDNIYRMSFDLDLLERAAWEANSETIQTCYIKGQSAELCRNYVRVLQSYGENQLYACGTYAFHPKCSWRQMENLTAIGYESGVGKCPFNPLSSCTSYMTDSGQIFTGTATDFMGSDAAILRADVDPKMNNDQKIIRTKQYHGFWLNDPQFVGSFEAGHFVYFLFREVAVEYMNCGKAIYSRIARVCKNDIGGYRSMIDNWTTFLKARLNCSLPGEYPFYFNEIQGMTYSTDEEVLYATFSTPENSVHGSAVCAFNISAINAAFEGPFKYQEHAGSEWKPINTTHRHQFQCESTPIDPTVDRHKRLIESSRYQLMDLAVQPLTTQPLYHANLERFKFIAIDTVHTKSEEVRVIYISTNKNFIKKLSVKFDKLNPRQAQTCLVEIWQSDDSNMSKILSMNYLKVTDSLYVGTDLALTKIPGQHCDRHSTQESCLNAMDPYCGWNERIEKCTPQELDVHVYKYWLQPEVLKCPLLTTPIDGGWSSWSEWEKCKKHGEEDGDCMCRSRKCSNPLPQNGGRNCKGITTEVQNCTVHGEWTEWSAWSVCSGTCGKAVKTRFRTCSNPKPAYGGRTCVGSDRSEIYCSQLPPCPGPTKPAVDGGWGPWGDWSECSAPCGGGFRIRRRECDDPAPQNGGQECPGCKIDYEDCNMHSCPEVKKLSSWTPWMVQFTEIEGSNEITTSKQRTERRYRYSCRATTPDAGTVRISLAKEETRTCYPDGSCQRHNPEHNENEAEHSTEWSACNVTCGGGIQYRNHEGKHKGRHSQSRPCNTHPCTNLPMSLNEVVGSHEWGCWTDWGPCSVSCGVGLRRRTRKCVGGNDKNCVGKAIEEQKCEMPLCTDLLGWGAWTEWSSCSNDGIRFRHRKCMVESPAENECRGSEYEKTACVPNENEGAHYLTAGFVASYVGLVILVASVCSFVTFWFTKRRYRTPVTSYKNNTSASPYDTYPNQYSSLPTKDIYDVRPRVKRQSSFNMCSPSKNINTGTLNRNNIHNHTPKVLASKTYNDYESTTLKRNSNAMNNHRNNIDDEKF